MSWESRREGIFERRMSDRPGERQTRDWWKENIERIQKEKLCAERMDRNEKWSTNHQKHGSSRHQCIRIEAPILTNIKNMQKGSKFDQNSNKVGIKWMRIEIIA
jgi:hypothetical protein